jgi:hypothetical protein
MNTAPTRTERIAQPLLARFAVVLVWIAAACATASANERVGVYDSRSVAVAYAGSALHEKQLQPLMAAMKQAKDAGDAKKVSALEAEGKALQAKMHRQAFSTASVADILALIPEEIAKIKDSERVATIVSKWDKAELDKHASRQPVDVTIRIVDALKPGERQRKSAIDIQKKKPVPADQLRTINR